MWRALSVFLLLAALSISVQSLLFSPLQCQEEERHCACENTCADQTSCKNADCCEDWDKKCDILKQCRCRPGRFRSSAGNCVSNSDCKKDPGLPPTTTEAITTAAPTTPPILCSAINGAPTGPSMLDGTGAQNMPIPGTPATALGKQKPGAMVQVRCVLPAGSNAGLNWKFTDDTCYLQNADNYNSMNAGDEVNTVLCGADGLWVVQNVTEITGRKVKNSPGKPGVIHCGILDDTNTALTDGTTCGGIVG